MFLGSLVVGRWRLPKFYLLYAVAFFVYAAGWMAAYFSWPGLGGEWLGGEWLGSLVGSILMAIAFAMAFGAIRSIGWANLSVKNGELNSDFGYVASEPRDRIFKRELAAELDRIRVFLGLSS